MTYNRAIHTTDGKCSCGLLEPQVTFVERLNDADEPVYQFGTFWTAQEKVLCFSEEIGGAVIGATTGEQGFRGGEYCLCKTEEKPDIDLVGITLGDFGVLKEVRFKRPVQTKRVGTFMVTPELLKDIEASYNCQFPTYEQFAEIEGEEMANEYYESAKHNWESQEGCPIDIDRLLEIREQITEQLIGFRGD